MTCNQRAHCEHYDDDDNEIKFVSSEKEHRMIHKQKRVKFIYLNNLLSLFIPWRIEEILKAKLTVKFNELEENEVYTYCRLLDNLNILQVKAFSHFSLLTCLYLLTVWKFNTTRARC